MTGIPPVRDRGRCGRSARRWHTAQGGAPLKDAPPLMRLPAAEQAGAKWLDRGDSMCGLLDATSEWISVLDLSGRILFINEAGRKALDMEGISWQPRGDWAALWPTETRVEARKAVRAAAAGAWSRFTACRLRRDGSSSWWDVALSPIAGGEGGPTSLAATMKDVTDRELAQEQLRWAANHDPVTMLPNRSHFQQQLEAEFAAATASGGSFSLLLLDIHGCKSIDEPLGVEAADALMSDMASRMRAGIRRGDFAARIGGQDFAVILGGISNEQHLTAAAEAIFDRVSEPYFHEGTKLECQVTIGASIFPQHGATRPELTKNAETALQTARETGRGSLRVFEAALRCEMQRHDSMLSLARHALRDNRVVPFYQPKVDLRDGTLYGFEALLRWRHPTLGIQSPETIQAAFQDDRLAAAISNRMIAMILADMRLWLDAGIEFGHVAVNAAAAEFRRGDFAERLLGQLNSAGIAPERLQLEVTEGVFLGRGAEHVLRALKAMSAAGIQIALDDFGTGYASLSHLKQFPVSTIKIDRSFVSDLHEDAGDEAIVRALVGLGRNLGVDVVAEGIETPAQSAYLRKHLCTYGQGYLFGAAEAADAVPALIKKFERAARMRLGALPAERPAKPGDVPRAAPAANRGNVYIVDDDVEVRDSIQFMLEIRGYNCRSFASGADFLGALLQLEPGCILLDVRMGGLSGLQVLRELRWMNLAWPVIVMSGELSNPLAAAAKAAGAHALLAKPFEESDLHQTLANAFHAIDAEGNGWCRANA